MTDVEKILNKELRTEQCHTIMQCLFPQAPEYLIDYFDHKFFCKGHHLHLHILQQDLYRHEHLRN